MPFLIPKFSPGWGSPKIQEIRCRRNPGPSSAHITGLRCSHPVYRRSRLYCRSSHLSYRCSREGGNPAASIGAGAHSGASCRGWYDHCRGGFVKPALPPPPASLPPPVLAQGRTAAHPAEGGTATVGAGFKPAPLTVVPAKAGTSPPVLAQGRTAAHPAEGGTTTVGAGLKPALPPPVDVEPRRQHNEANLQPAVFPPAYPGTISGNIPWAASILFSPGRCA